MKSDCSFQQQLVLAARFLSDLWNRSAAWGSKAWKIFRKLLELETRRSLIHPPPFQNHTPSQKNMFEKRIRRQQMAQGFQGISGFQRVIGFSYFNRRRWNSENSNLSRMDIFWHNSRIFKKWQKPAAFRDLNINQHYQYQDIHVSLQSRSSPDKCLWNAICVLRSVWDILTFHNRWKSMIFRNRRTI